MLGYSTEGDNNTPSNSMFCLKCTFPTPAEYMKTNMLLSWNWEATIQNIDEDTNPNAHFQLLWRFFRLLWKKLRKGHTRSHTIVIWLTTSPDQKTWNSGLMFKWGLIEGGGVGWEKGDGGRIDGTALLFVPQIDKKLRWKQSYRHKKSYGDKNV